MAKKKRVESFDHLTKGAVGLKMRFTFKALLRLSGNGGRTSFNLFI